MNPSDSQISTQGNLANKTIKGILWSGLSFVGNKGVTFLSTIILARLLTPDDFGLMALGLLSIAYLDTFGGLGVGNVVIYKQDDIEKNSNVAFTIGILANIGLALIGFFSAPLVAFFFNAPRLTEILQALSVTLVISGLGSIHRARLDKDLKFNKSFIPELGKTLAKAVVSIGLALAGFGVWSLVFGQIAANLAASSLYWMTFKWRPRLMLEAKTVKSLLGYSSHILLVEIMGIIQSNLDYLIIGRRFDASTLGYYTMAYKIPELAIVFVCSTISSALFPAFSKIQDNKEALKAGYLIILKYVSLYTIPAGIGIALIAADFVVVGYGEKWVPAIPVMQVLAVFSIVYSLAYNAGDIYKATGRPDILTKLSFFEMIVAVPMLWLGANYGILYVAVAHLAANSLLTIVKFIVVYKLINLKLGEMLAALQPSVTTSTVMLISVYGVGVLIQNFASLPRLVLLTLTGIATYAAALLIFNRPTAQYAFNLVRQSFSSRFNRS